MGTRDVSQPCARRPLSGKREQGPRVASAAKLFGAWLAIDRNGAVEKASGRRGGETLKRPRQP